MILASAPPVRAGSLLPMRPASAERALAQVTGATLNQLRLPDDVFKLLEPSFEAAGWTLEHRKIEDPFSEPLHFTVATKDPEERCLLHFDREDGTSALKEFSEQNRFLVSRVWERLAAHYRREGRLHIVHRVKPHPVFSLLIKKRFVDSYGLSTELVPLDDIDQLITTPALLQEQLEDWLQLGSIDKSTQDDTGPQKRPARKMLKVELGKLVTVLSNSPSFLSSEDRKSFLEAAGLAELVPQFDLQGAASKVAPPLVFGLDNPSLGQLIQALAMQDLDPEDADFTRSLFERYSFEPETDPDG